MHITDWLEMLGEHFPLVVIGCAEALLAVVLLCAALRNRRQCTDKKRSALRRADEILLYNMDRQSNDVCRIMRQHDLLPICAADDMQSLLGVTFPSGRDTVRGPERSRSRPSFGQRTASGCRHRVLTRLHSRRHING